MTSKSLTDWGLLKQKLCCWSPMLLNMGPKEGNDAEGKDFKQFQLK